MAEEWKYFNQYRPEMEQMRRNRLFTVQRREPPKQEKNYWMAQLFRAAWTGLSGC